MNQALPEAQPAKVWLVGAIAAGITGGATALAFAVWWYSDIGGHCGSVRFYEQVFGAILVAGWLTGTALGLLLAFLGS